MESFDSSMHDLLYMKGYLFEIPNYQRSYVWEKDEITAFLKDITYCYEQNIAGQAYDHFFGQMVFREVTKDRADRTILEVVDGQQRLTTITLIVAAIYRLILIKEPIINDKVLEQLRILKKQYLISMPDRGSPHRVLTLSPRDNPILIAIATVKEEKIDKEFCFDCLYESHARIFNAYTQIFKYLEKYFAETDESSFSQTLSAFIETILRNFSVVLIKPKSVGYSYALYQVVNDRGVLLTSAELLKARTMELLSNNEGLFIECEAVWNDILNDPGKETTKYLLWHYSSKMHQSATKSKLHEAYEKKIFNCYGKHSLNDADQAKLADEIRSLHQSVKLCRKLSIGELPMEKLHPQIQDMYKALVCGLNNEIAIPVYINMLNLTDEKLKLRIVPFVTVLLSRFFFASRTIANIHNNSISKAYNAISESICTNAKDFDKLVDCCKDIQSSKRVDNTFSAKMDDSIYSRTSTAVSKYLLYMLELFEGSTAISEKAILSRDASMVVCFEKITTEHIASRSGADGNTFTENERDCLGNLTLLGDNKNNELDDKPFSEKREIYVKSPYALTRVVGANLKWDRDEYDSWQSRQKSNALKIFII